MIDVRMFTVGPVQENCYFVRRPGADTAVVVDPGEEADRLIEAKQALGIETVAAILITHSPLRSRRRCQGAARRHRCSVYVPELEREVLANINGYVRPGVRTVREL